MKNLVHLIWYVTNQHWIFLKSWKNKAGLELSLCICDIYIIYIFFRMIRARKPTFSFTQTTSSFSARRPREENPRKQIIKIMLLMLTFFILGGARKSHFTSPGTYSFFFLGGGDSNEHTKRTEFVTTCLELFSISLHAHKQEYKRDLKSLLPVGCLVSVDARRVHVAGVKSVEYQVG